MFTENLPSQYASHIHNKYAHITVSSRYFIRAVSRLAIIVFDECIVCVDGFGISELSGAELAAVAPGVYIFMPRCLCVEWSAVYDARMRDANIYMKHI